MTLMDTKTSHVIQDHNITTINYSYTANNAAKPNEILIQPNLLIFLTELVLGVLFLFPAAMYSRKIVTTLCLDHDAE